MNATTLDREAIQKLEVLTHEEAAAYLVIEPRTLRLWRRTRGLPHRKLTSKVVRYSRRELDEWSARHQ